VSTESAQRHWLARPACIAAGYTIVLRTVYALYAALTLDHLTLDPRLVYSNSFTDHLIPRSERLTYVTLGVWERFDTLWYLHIAQSGYDRPAAIVFYPLYPLLIRAFSWLTHPPLLAALLVSTASSFFFFWGLQVLVELDYARSVAIRAVYLAGIWPASFMWFAGYPDSTVLACAIWSIYFARRDQWLLAGLAGALGGATKAVGCLVAAPLALLGWREKNWRAWPAILALLPPLVYSAWTRLSGLGSIPEVYSHDWRTTAQYPWITLAQCLQRFLSGNLDLLFRLNFVFFALVCCLAFLNSARVEYRWYAAAMLMLFLTKRTDPLLQSTMRYAAAVFPAFMGLAVLVQRPLALILVSIFLLAANAVLLLKFFEWSLVV